MKKPRRVGTAHREAYKRIDATVDADGNLVMIYRVSGRTADGRMFHDEDVSALTDNEIRQLVCELLTVPDSDRSQITLEREDTY